MAQEDSEKRMGFFEHLEELRVRFMRCLWVFLVGFAASYFLLTEQVLAFLRKPLFHVLPPEQQKLYFTSLFENFFTHLKIAGFSALLFCSPYFFYELWGFIAPGLYERERKWVMPFVFFGSVFFTGGAAFAYFVLFPVAFHFFVTYGASTDVPLLTIDAYYGTCLKLMFLFGLAFDFPVILVLLGCLGMIDAQFLRRHRRNAILAIAVSAAVFAPPDAISMLILMAPLILMYEGTIWVIHWIGSKRRSEPEIA